LVSTTPWALIAAQVRVAFVAGGKAQRIPKALRDAMEAH
jgi:acyl-CoA thioester hydrolase